jgi:carboxymethylenebutenolidase
MDQKIINLFDGFTHGGMSRREFMDKLTKLAGGTAAAMAILPVLENNYAKADILPEGDARIATELMKFEGGSGYLVKPTAAGKYPAVVVIHENRGLNPHIKDVARRMAAEGFVALAPDYLTGLGGTPDNADKAKEMIGTLKPGDILATSKAALAAVRAHAIANGKAGAMGFCWGGGAVNALAVADDSLSAGVAYYGMQPKDEDVAKIKAPLMLHYGALDDRINAGIPAFETALKAGNKTYELFKYESVNHAFNNDTNEARYNKAAADLAWGRTVAFLKKNTA